MLGYKNSIPLWEMKLEAFDINQKIENKMEELSKNNEPYCLSDDITVD